MNLYFSIRIIGHDVQIVDQLEYYRIIHLLYNNTSRRKFKIYVIIDIIVPFCIK